MKELTPDELSKEQVWVFAITEEGKIPNSIREVINAGRKVASELDKELHLLLFSEKEFEKEEFLDFPLDKIYLVKHPIFSEFYDDVIAKVIIYLVKKANPIVLFFSADYIGSCIAPRVAGVLKVGLCAHVNKIEVKNGKILLYRPTFENNIITVLSSKTYPVMATISTMASVIQDKEDYSPEIIKIKMPNDFDWKSGFKIEKKEAKKESISPLYNAKLVIAGGRGIGKKSTFDKLFVLAQKLNGEVGATRPICYKGWVDEERMIGISGVCVKPKVYIGFGISGALQHVAGIEDSEFIIAVNKDKNAPLVKLAHLSLIGDAEQIIEHLLKLVEK